MQELLDWLEYLEDGRQRSKVRHKPGRQGEPAKTVLLVKTFQHLTPKQESI